MRNEPERVDAYLAALPDESRLALAQVRATVRECAPDAIEGIAYDMPAFYLGNKFLISYAAFKKHLSLYPATDLMVDDLGDELRPFFHGKGTIRFTVLAPLPTELLRKIVRRRLDELVGASPAPD